MTIGKKLSAGFLANAVLLAALGTALTLTNTKVVAISSTLFALILDGIILLYVRRSVTDGLSRIAAEVAEGAEYVFSAAGQISHAGQSLAEDTSQSAASLEETSASTEEINSMARRNSQNSYSAANLVHESNNRFNDANILLNDMVVAMKEINTSSDKISKIIKVIDEIAFQTNILALNAAVEAARAGEAGMGFAVVADEVRSLAQRSAQAARDTAVLIEESIWNSESGRVKVDQVTKAVKTIADQTAQIKTLVDEVQLGSEEQSRGIEQIGKAIAQMEQTTHKVAASAEETASAGRQLSAQSAALKEIGTRLNALVGAARPGRPSPARKSPRSVSPLPAVSARPVATKQPVTVPALSSSKSPGTPEDVFPMDSDFAEF